MAQAMNDDQRREKLRAMVSGIRTCMSTTLDAQGRMHARPMAAMTGPDAEDTIWFRHGGESWSNIRPDGSVWSDIALMARCGNTLIKQISVSGQ